MKRSRTKLALLAFLGMMSVVNAWAQDVVKNTTKNTSYATLQDAFYNASQGDVIELLGDVDATVDEEFNDDFNLGIEESITLKGNNHTLTVNRRGISVARQSSNSRRMGAPAKAPGNTINVTIQDLTIKNVAAQVKRKGGQIINTRGGIGTLTLNNVTFDTQGTDYIGDVRPLVIGGSQSTAATVNITGCTFTNPTAPTGKNSIAINVLNPVTMNIQGTTINAQYVINLGGADSSYGSQGSEVAFNGSTVNASAGAAVLFDVDEIGSGANGSTVTLAGETKVTTPTADWYDMGDTENNTIVCEHFATNYISATKYETKPTIQIATVADLQALATLCNSSSTSGQTAGNTYELTADLDLSGVAWTPAGGLDSYPGTSFKGTFDGKEHTISNLTCTDTHANYATAALFGAVKNAVIKNLTLKDVNINSTHYAAAFVAYKADGTCTIDNCHVDGGSIVSTPELLGSSYDNGDKVGAIVGYVNSADITNCSVNGVTIQGYRDLGGLAGYMAGGTVTDNTVADVTIIQSDENGYKTNSDGSLQDMSSTVGQVVGGRSGVIAQANDPSKNVANNVTIEFTGVLAKIGEAKFSTVSAAVAAATEGQTVEIYVADTYTLPNLPKNITIEGKVDGVVFSHTSAGNIASVPNGATFKNVTFNFGNVDYHGFQHAGKITMNDCTLNGRLSSYGDMEFVGCTFNAPGTEESGITSKDYSMWAYSGNLTYTDCTFNCNGKCINVYNESGATLYTITAKNCTFNSKTANKAAFNVKATSAETTPLKFKVIIEDCEATGSWPAASESETLVVLNALAQVDDINSEVASDIEVMEIEDGVETLHYPARVAEYKGTRYNTLAEALDAAEAANDKNIVINLLNDATLDITAWNGTQNPLSIGTAETESITINGNNKKLTFIYKNSDWNNVATMNDEVTKLILNNMAITHQLHPNSRSTWNAYDINFNCAVELNNVTSDKALAFKNAATLNNVTITDTGDIYGIWIQPNGQTVSIDGLNLTCGRGIKIDDQYLDDPELTTLNIANATFVTTAKSAILVKSAANTVITAGENINIENVAADNTNLVWVDEDRAEEYYKVTTTGATMVPEKLAQYVATLVRGEQTRGYYKTFAAAYNSTDYQDGDSYELLKNTTETVVVDKELTIVKNGFTAANLTAGEDYTKNETDEVITFVELPNVAQIGETGYKTLQKAVDAAHEMTGDVTITLLDNISGYAIVHQKAGLNLTVDGADKTVAGQIFIDGDGRSSGTETLTIQNIKFEDDMSNFYSGTDAFVLVPSTKDAGKPYYTNKYNYAHNITISDCSFNSTADAFKVVGFKSNSGAGCYNLVISNVSGDNLHSFAQLTATTGATFDNCSATQTGSFIGVNGGGGTYTVSNCTFESHPDKADGYAYREKSSSTAVATLTNNNFKAHDAIILGSAGTINVESGTYVGEISKTAGTIALSGGQFSADLTDAAYESFIAEGMIGVKNDAVEGAPYSVEVGTYVAQVTVGETTHNYSSLEAAFADAVDGATITLLADCAGNGIQVPQGKYSTGLTVDFANFTYTVDGATVGSAGTETQAFQLLKDNNITFMNGTIYSEKALMLVQNYSNLTLENMTLDGSALVGNGRYTLSNNNGNVVIDNSTIIAKEGSGNFAFDVCRYSNYTSVNVEVKGESVINGNIEISASGNDAKDGFGLTLTAGTLNGEIVLDPSAAAAMEATPEKAVITKADSFEAAAPADYKWVSNGDGTSTLAPKVYLAQIGDVKYESLAEAVAAVPADGTQTTITMIANEMINVVGYAVTIPANKNVVLDLNGYQVVGTVDQEGTSALIRNLGTLTIKDGSDTGTGKLMSGASTTWTWDGTDDYSGSYASNLIRNEKDLIVESGYLYNMSKGSAAYAIDNYSAGNVTINGGTIDAAKASAVRMFYVNGGSITVNDGIVGHYVSDDDCSYMGIQVMSGANVNVSVTGGTLAGQYALYANNTGGEIVLSGGTFDGYVGFAASVPNISITDGTFNEWAGTWGDQTGFISGGQFVESVDAAYLAEGYVCSEEPVNGYYTVTLGVAKIGVTGYPTFTAAVEAATEDDVITLLADIAEPYTLSLDETLKVALDGHALTVNSAVVGFEASGSLDNGVTTYTLVPRDMSDEDIVLIDGEPYEYIRNAQVKSATYVRTTKSSQTGKYQPWFVPFDYTITENDLEKFKFYKLNMVANSPNVEEEATDDKIWVFVKPMKAGDVLYANKPYAFKPKEVVTDYEFTTQNANLKARANGSVLEMATSDATYSFYGNYETTDLIYSDGYRDYYMGGGKLYFIEDGYPVTLGSYRWYLRNVAKDGNYSRGITFFEVDDEVTGIDNTVAGEEMVTYYTLDGVQVKTPGKGIYIMRFANGKTKKVSIK